MIKNKSGYQLNFQNINIYYFVLLVIILWGTVIRMVGLNKGIWLDEYSTMDIIFREDFLGFLRTYDHPPLYFFLLKLWSLISVKESFLRLLSVIFGVGTLTFMMLWIKQYSKLASILAGILCATAPVMLRYSHEIRNYSLLLFFTTLSFFFASRIAKNQNDYLNIFGLAISMSMMVATHLIGIMLTTTIGLFILISIPNPKKISIKFFLTILIPCIVFLFLYFVFLDQMQKNNWWMPTPSFTLVLDTIKYISGWSTLYGLQSYIQLSTPLFAISFEYLIKIIAATFGCLLLLGNWRRSFPFIAAVIVLWIQLLAYSFIVKPIFWYRTALPSMLPLLAFVSIQIGSIRFKRIKYMLIVIVILVSLLFSANWIVNDAGKPIERWKETAFLLEKQRDLNDLVMFFPRYIEGPIKYYMPNLPTEMTIRVGNNLGNFDKIKVKINEIDPDEIFLVVRHDITLENTIETYQGLLDYLEDKFGSPMQSYEFGILSLTKYRNE